MAQPQIACTFIFLNRGVISIRGKILSLFYYPLSTFSPDSPCKLNILRHNSNTLGMDGAQVSVLEKTNEVSFGSLLKGKNSCGLETKISLEVLCNLTDETLERGLANEEIGRLLVLSDLTKSYSSGTITMRFLYSSCGGGRLTSGLCGELK